MKIKMPASIEDLPDPIIEYILSYLSPYRDLKQCMLVNRAWYRYVYDVVRKTQRDFYQAVCSMSVQWCHLVAEPGLTISKRYSHSSCCNGNSMYVFGGCTTANTTFNDLWRLDLGTRCWIRPLATGTYPPPKACATLVSHGDNLVLFGGWTHTAPYPLHQVWRVFNQIHIYNTITNRWSQMISIPACTPMAGHSATVHGDYMVVFGGIQRQDCDGPFLSSNEVWTLELNTFKWQKQCTTAAQPPARYGHSQIFIDRYHLLIMGGCGGPNMLYSDVWVLKMTDDIEEIWEWQEMNILMKENAAPHLAFHPACKVGSQVVVMSKAQRSRTSPSSLPHLLRAPSRIWVPPRLDVEDSIEMKVAKHVPDIEPCVNGKRGVLKRHLDHQHSKSSQRSSSDEDDCHLPDVAKRKNNNSVLNCSVQNSHNIPSTSGVQCAVVGNNTVPLSAQCAVGNNTVPLSAQCAVVGNNTVPLSAQCAVGNNTVPLSAQCAVVGNNTVPVSAQCAVVGNNTVPVSAQCAVVGNNTVPLSAQCSTSKKQNDAAAPTSNNSASKSDSRFNSRVNPMIRRNRQRQLEGLDRMEQRLKDLRAGSMSFGLSPKVCQKPHRSPVITTKNPMCLYVLDISTALSDGYVTWRVIKRQSPSAPEEIILYTLVLGKGELVMFGGIQKDLNSRQQEGESVPEVVSNSLHFMTAERFVI